MNQWKKEAILAVLRNLMHFAVWFCIVPIGLMAAAFATEAVAEIELALAD